MRASRRGPAGVRRASPVARRLLVLVGAALPALLACGGASAPAPPRHVVIVSLDTTRTDHIGAYGSQVRTPRIDELAAEGIVFENADSACTATLPSHTSLFTGTWPAKHGVARNGYRVHPDNLMLPEILKDAGFRTIGVSSAVALSALLGFAQGFDVWDQDPEGFEGHVIANEESRRAAEITDAAIAEIDRVAFERMFLFVHYVDPHRPYDPPEPWRSQNGPVPDGLRGSWEVVKEARLRHRGPGVPLTAADIRNGRREPRDDDVYLARLYAGEVGYLDHQVGRLFDALRERGLYDDSVIVVTADHGETFWEHADAWSHGIAAYQTTVSIPLILRLPGARLAGTRIGALVSNIDVAPTLLALLGLPPAAFAQGRSLLPLLEGAEQPPRPVFSQGPLPAGPLEVGVQRWLNERKTQSVRLGRWKYVRTPYLQLEELYDLETDPQEQRNLLPDPSPEARQQADRLAAELDRFLAAANPFPSEFYPRRRDEGADDADGAARRAMWERLRQLGYVEEGEKP
jgi:arylsulfatase A-like enzyme